MFRKLPNKYTPSIYYRDYRINSKSLNITPVEKPDMSPYLVHMTGEKQILQILQSGEDDHEGLIKSSIPTQSKSKWYDKKIVCFTESPLHSIDAFRYIAFKRFENNMLYGIGFSKAKLALRKRVKPALYMDKYTIGDIYELSLKENIDEDVRSLIDQVMPYTTPIFQDDYKQGYTWEREWRYHDDEGFLFSYRDIKIICCPSDEKKEIELQLGSYAKDITFVSTWSEYNEVTEFLQSREFNNPKGYIESANKLDNLNAKKIELNRVKIQLELYKEYSENFLQKIKDLECNIKEFQFEIDKVDSEIKLIEDENNKKIKQREERQKILDSKCDECERNFEEKERKIKYNSGLDFDERLQPYICKDCAIRMGVSF